MTERFVVGTLRGKAGVFDLERDQFANFQPPEAAVWACEVRAGRAAQWLNDGSMTPSGFVWEKLPKGLLDEIGHLLGSPVEVAEAADPTPTPPRAIQRGTGPYSPAEWEAFGEDDPRL